VALLAIGAACWLISDNFRSLIFLTWRAGYFAVHPAPPRCKQRAAEFQANVARIRRDAINSLKIGSKRDDLLRFFASENIPLTFNQIGQDHEARGSIYVTGLPECENVACGDDSAAISMSVKINADGIVVSEPVVVGVFMRCL
jgi:hypothetical protein